VTKPFSKERVAPCLQRLATKRTPQAETVPNRIVARKRRSLVFLAIDDIWAFESSDRLTSLHSPHGVYDIDLSLAAIELSFGRPPLLERSSMPTTPWSSTHHRCPPRPERQRGMAKWRWPDEAE